MRPSARLQTIMDAVQEYLQLMESGQQQPADSWLKQWVAPKRYMGSGDRRAIGESFFTILRRLRSLQWQWQQLAGDAGNSRTWVLLASLQHMKLSLAELMNLCDGSPHAPRPCTDTEQAILQAWLKTPDMLQHAPLAIQHDLPDWVLPELVFTPDHEAAWETCFNAPAPADIRINPRKTNRESMLKLLQKNNIQAKALPHSPLAIRVEGRAALQALPEYQDGWFELQDASSQLAVEIMVNHLKHLSFHASKPLTVIDWCAGAGGKTLALAARLAESLSEPVRIYAHDVDGKRLARLQERASRAGVEPITCTTETHSLPFADAVLVDAPCTGTGTWRRNPWRKWQCQPQEYAHWQEVQQKVVQTAVAFVRPGGAFFYSTCSLLQGENQQQNEWIKNNFPNTYPLSIQDMLPQTGISAIRPQENMLQLSPLFSLTDGFFISVFALRE